MEEKAKNAVKTFEDLAQAVADSGRPYDAGRIEKAYEMAAAAHAGQTRLSGESYVSHPVAVACLVVDLGLDTDSVVAALLHDSVEDTETTAEDVKAAFGPDVALLVDGVTKLGRIKFSSVEEQQAENLRKMLLAMSKDVRVMLIKLCDRLHNMRTGDGWPEQKRRDKALETMEVYAPIAHRLGMSNVKEELEDRSLQYLDPVGYEEITSFLAQNGGADSFISGIADRIKERLAENGMDKCTIKKRIKSVYGIYRKMYMQNRTFEEIYDVYAVRIILDTVGECYNALGVIHDMYHPIPSRFKDYISTPKPNMYQSLHTTVIGHEGIPFEVQIRTWEMDQTAEYGVAAHWKYKAGVSTKDNVIDFAYAIHSAVGNRMVGAKVNSRIVPIDHKVVTGEIIEIITGPKDKGPSRDWLNLVATSEAKNKIRNWFKKERKEENITEGKAALDKEMRRNLITIPEEKYDEFMADLARRQRLNTPEELYAAIGYGGIQLSRLMIKIKDEYTKLLKEQSPAEVLQVPIKKQKSSEGVIVEGLDNCLVKFAKCCNPLPGDDIIGFITRGFGVSIHKRSCSNARAGLLGDDAPRWVNAHWAESVKESFKSSLEISAMDRDGLMADVAGLIAEMHLPCYAISARQLADGRATMALTIGVNNTEHLNTVIARLRKIKSITTITRV